MGATAGDGQGLQGRVDAIFGTADARGTVAGTPFSPFRHADVAKSEELEDALADALVAGGMDGVVAQAERFAADPEAPTGAVKHALKTFITHTPAAAAELRLPTAAARTTVPAREAHLELASGHPTLPAPNPLTEPPAERALDRYRPDPFANDHHGHWHVVYPTGGVRLPGGTRRTQPRQGELFLYVHQQMLARYDTERAIAGLRPVVPFRPPYDEPIPEGYGLTGYVTRPPGDRLQSILEGPTLTDIRGAHQQLDAAARGGLLVTDDGRDVALDEPLLGAATEQSYFFPDGARRPLPVLGAFPNLHGNGHVLTALVEPDPRPEEEQWFGAILHTEAAICDPFFYRWHRHIDNLGATFQDTQPPNDFAAHAAEVRLGKGAATDLALCFTSRIPGADAAGFDFAAWGRATLGDDLAGQHPARTDELLTRFVESEIVLPHTNQFWTRHGLLRDVVHLEHEPFTCFLRAENPRATEQDVTVRLFLCLAEHVEERRMWIELDKFRATLAPGVNVVAQPDARSSVIKRRGLEAPGAEGGEGWDPVAYCDCGWPYTLLLPSGASSADGTSFVLMAALTDWSWDRANDEARTCGSMSFCGAQDKYPDRQAMGYPFNRPFDGGVVSAIDATPSMTRRDLTIRCENPAPGRA
jgi:tyrosinase